MGGEDIKGKTKMIDSENKDTILNLKYIINLKKWTRSTINRKDFKTKKTIICTPVFIAVYLY